MEDQWLKRWNDRYTEPGYSYGIHPNAFLKERLDPLAVGKILFAAEGEGRNAVYAATKGWDVSAFDISKAGKLKAMQLAEEHRVSFAYHVGQLPDLELEDEAFDVIALIYAHFPPEIKSSYHRILDTKLKKGGIVLFEAFGKNHLSYRKKNPTIGGPPDLDSLFSVEELQADFQNYDTLLLEEVEVELHEGKYHNGIGSVTRFVGRKK